MSTILFAWELGGGLGHVTRIRPLAEKLQQRGHRVVVAARDLKVATRVMREADIACIQAPFVSRRPGNAVKVPLTYAHILHNIGFADVEQLSAQVEQWQQLFSIVQPDSIVCDHSPTALLAAKWTRARRVVFGDGFCCPPNTSPLPDLRPWLDSDPQRLIEDEQRTLSIVNEVLISGHQCPLARLSDLYGDGDDTLLTTFFELDHFNRSQEVEYWGTCPSFAGAEPKWPTGSGKKVFAYLKPNSHIGFFFELLRVSGLPTLVYVKGISPHIRERHEGSTLKFADSPLDLRRVGAECDFAILNATHGATSAFLLSGKPILQLPIYLEQSLTARNTVRLGTGVAANLSKPEDVATSFRRIVESNEFDQPAADFAARYADVDADAQLDKQVLRLERSCHRERRECLLAG